jgi:hypothetical protein
MSRSPVQGSYQNVLTGFINLEVHSYSRNRSGDRNHETYKQATFIHRFCNYNIFETCVLHRKCGKIEILGDDTNKLE